MPVRRDAGDAKEAQHDGAHAHRRSERKAIGVAAKQPKQAPRARTIEGGGIPDGNVDDTAYFNLNVKCASRAQGALGLIISAGLTHSANWSPVKSPSASPASMSDVPSWCAFFATLAALS